MRKVLVLAVLILLLTGCSSDSGQKTPVVAGDSPKDPIEQSNHPERPRQKELVLEIEGQTEKVKASLYESKWGYSTYVPEGFSSISENWSDKFTFDLSQKYYMLITQTDAAVDKDQALESWLKTVKSLEEKTYREMSAPRRITEPLKGLELTGYNLSGQFIRVIVFQQGNSIYQANMYYDEDGEEGMIPRFNVIMNELSFSGLTETQPAQFNFVKMAKEDLNGDGIMEEINLTAFDDGGDFILQVGRASIKGKLNQGGADGFVIVDIDKSDKYKEVAVHTPGPSSDDEFLVYGYDGTTLKEVGRLFRWPTFVGNGIVYVDDWMAFWNKTSKYILTDNRILKHVPQEFYSINQEGTVRESFTLRKSRTDNSIVANLQKGSKITIVLCAPPSQNYYEDWFLIKSETNLLGWAKGRDMFERVDGLSFAD